MKISSKDQISLVRHLIANECKDRNINLEGLYVGTKTSFFIDTVLKDKNFKLSPSNVYKELKDIQRLAGFYIDKQCVIFTKNYAVTLDESVEFTKSVLTALHELTHAEQYMKQNKYLHKNFIYEMERVLIDFDEEVYKKYHDDFFIEIEANHRAYEESEKYIGENNYIIDTSNNKKLIEQYSAYYKDGYNFEFFLKEFEKVILKNPKAIEDKNTLKKFYKEDGTPVELDYLLQNEEFMNSQRDFKYTIMQTRLNHGQFIDPNIFNNQYVKQMTIESYEESINSKR